MIKERKIGKKAKILIVDDDQGVQNLLLRFFKKKGYTDIRDAATGKEAILRVQEDIPNVVLLDLRLPDMDGREVLLKIKEINKDIPVIIITGYADLDIARNILKEGACDFIVKPFDLDYLEKSVLTKTFFLE